MQVEHGFERSIIVSIDGVEKTRMMFHDAVVTATELNDDMVLSGGDVGKRIAAFQIFKSAVQRDFSPERGRSLAVEKVKFQIDAGILKGELKMGTPTPIHLNLEYDPATSEFKVKARLGFEISWAQWIYWLDWISGFQKMSTRFE